MKKKRKNICYIAVLLLLSTVLSNAQLIDHPYYYGSKEVRKSLDFYNNSTVRKSELKLIDVVNKFPDNPSMDRAVLLSANVDFLTKNYKVADARLADFIEKRNNSPIKAHAGLLRAYIAFEQKKYNKAAEFFAKSKLISEAEFLIRNDSIYRVLAHNALFWGGISLCHQGKYQDAKPLFEECFRIYPDLPNADDALYVLGIIEEINHNFDLAISYNNTIAKKYPKSNTFIASRIREINNKLILRESISALDILANTQNTIVHISMNDSIGKQFEPQNYIENAGADLQYLSGEAQNIAGNYEQALIEYRTYIETYSNPELIDYVNLGAGWALLNLDRNKEAIENYDKVINNDKSDNDRAKATAKLFRAIALKRDHNKEQALKELSALSIQPSYPFVGQSLLELGQMYYEEGQFDDARRALERAEREANEGMITVRINLILGATYLELRNWDKSVIEYTAAEQIALRSSPIFMPKKDWYIAEARLKKGISLVLNHRNAEAITVLNTFIGDNKRDNRMDESLFWLAEAYYRSDLLKNAAETYGILIKQYPQSKRIEEAMYGEGWSYFRLQQFNKSSEIFTKMARQFPHSKYALEVLARQADGYYITKDYKNAADAYKKAADYAPKTDEGQYCAYQLCHALYRLGSYEKSITSLLSFVRTYTGSKFAPYALYLIGWIRFQQKDYSEAIENFRFLIQAYTQHELVIRAHYAIGDAYYNAGNYESAIEAYKVVVQQFPSSEFAPEAWRGMQYSYMALGKDDEAIRIADSVISTYPNTPFAQDLFIKKADMFYSGARYKDAVDEYQNFIKSYPESERNAEALYWMGKSMVNMNENDKASDAFVQVQKKYPKTEFAVLGMLENALLNKKTGDILKCDSILKSLQSIYPEHQSAVQAGFERALIKHEMGDTLGAMSLYKEVAESYPGKEYADQSRYRIAGYYRSKNMNDSARVNYEIIVQSMSDISLAAEAQFRVGEMWMRDTNWVKSAEAFNAVRDKYQNEETWYPLALLNLGEVYEKMFDFNKAIEIYQALLNQRPDDEYGKTVKLRLNRLEKNK